MANDTTDKTAEATAEKAPAKAAAAPKAVEETVVEDTYSQEWLLSASGHLGYAPHEVAGAFALPGTPDTMTIPEAQAAVAAWLTTPVRTEA